MNIKLLSVVLATTIFAGCSTTTSMNGGDNSAMDPNMEGVETFGVDSSSLNVGDSDLGSQQFGMVGDNFNDYTQNYYEGLQKVYYFDFNQSKLKEGDLEELQRFASFAKDFPQLKLRLEGHADERGTREYNIALGERRGESVAVLFRANGAANEHTIISYGEEKPVAIGHAEDSWWQNRRVEVMLVK